MTESPLQAQYTEAHVSIGSRRRQAWIAAVCSGVLGWLLLTGAKPTNTSFSEQAGPSFAISTSTSSTLLPKSSLLDGVAFDQAVRRAVQESSSGSALLYEREFERAVQRAIAAL